MFVRPCYRKKDGKRHAYWALVESYRTERGLRQRIVAYLGDMDEAGRLGVKDAADSKPPNRQSHRLGFWKQRKWRCWRDFRIPTQPDRFPAPDTRIGGASRSRPARHSWHGTKRIVPPRPRRVHRARLPRNLQRRSRHNQVNITNIYQPTFCHPQAKVPD